MFGWLKKRPAHRHVRADDAMWQTADARRTGVVARAAALADRGEAVAIAVYVPGVLRSLQVRSDIEVLEPHQVNVSRMASLGRGKPEMHLLLVGVPPDPDGEEALFEACKTLPFTIRLQAHHSLDDAHMVTFVSPRLKAMLASLGMTPDEAIEHRWVTSAIRSARKKSAAAKG